MLSLPFSSLSPAQAAQAATIFQDALFGSDPKEYTYEVTASGWLSGQRARLETIPRCSGRMAEVKVSSLHPLQLSRSQALNLVRVLGISGGWQ
jgi:hypothetical protein